MHDPQKLDSGKRVQLTGERQSSILLVSVHVCLGSSLEYALNMYCHMENKFIIVLIMSVISPNLDVMSIDETDSV